MFHRNILNKIADKLPYVQNLKKLVKHNQSALFVEPGHFYSPLVDTKHILEEEHIVFAEEKQLNGINLNEVAQWRLLENFKEYYRKLSFPENPVEAVRYFYNNPLYSYSDAIFLFSMMLHHQPKRIIEIGSGFSSAAMLDVNEEFFNNSIDITFIEPYPENLKNIIKPGDQFTLLENKVQDVDINIFKSL